MTEQRLSFPPEGAALREVRAKVREMAAALGAAPEIQDRVALVVDELVNNAIEHGASYREAGTDLSVSIRVEGEHLAIDFFDLEMPTAEVAELAEGLRASAAGMPALESERGRGLFLLSVYLEDLAAGPAEQGGLRLSGRLQRQ